MCTCKAEGVIITIRVTVNRMCGYVRESQRRMESIYLAKLFTGAFAMWGRCYMNT